MMDKTMYSKKTNTAQTDNGWKVFERPDRLRLEVKQQINKIKNCNSI